MKSQRFPPIYGLTGGVASGKSTIASYFSELGIPTLDADQVARELRSEKGEAAPLILARFKTLNSEELKKMIFQDPQAKKDLEAILHPLIQEKSKLWFKRQSSQSPYLIYEASLLIETGRAFELSGLILVESTPTAQINRLMKRDGVTEELARQILGSQMTQQEKLKTLEKHTALVPHFFNTILANTSQSLELLKEEVKKLDTHLRTLK